MFTDELLFYIFDGQPHLLTESMETWLAASRRFADFVNTFRDKIRKKVRTTQDQETLLDLRLELETAYLLLREPRLSLEYELGQSERVRRPDFAVSFTTSLTFMVEVTRLRAEQKSIPTKVQDQTPIGPGSNHDPTIPPPSDRLADTICSKLGQLLPQHSNILLVGMDAPLPTSDDLRTALFRIQQRAERNDVAFMKRYQFRDRTDFFKYFQRLSEVLVRSTQLRPDEPVVVWVNPQAKYPLPGKVRTVLHRSHTV